MFNKLICLIKGHKYKDDVLVTKYWFPYQESHRHVKRCERCGKIVFLNK